MARAHAMAVAYDPTTNTILTSATVNVYSPGTVTPIGATIFDRNGNVLSNPLTSDATTGLIDFYLGVAQEVDLVVSKASFTTRTYSNVPVLDDASNNLTALLTTTGQIVYASANNTPAALNIGTSNQMLVVSGGVPAWTSTLTSPHMTTPTVDSGGLTITAGGLTVTSGTTTLTAGPITIGTNPAGTGQVRLPTGLNGALYQRNAANNADLVIGYDGSDRLALNTSATALANSATAGANSLPANPFGFLVTVIDGTVRKIPVYNN